MCDGYIHLQKVNTMKTHKSIATLLSASAFTLMLTSCESPQEEAREDAVLDQADRMEEKADQVREDAERNADMKEESADQVRDISGNEAQADAIENEADRIRENAEERADQLEDNADVTREAE